MDSPDPELIDYLYCQLCGKFSLDHKNVISFYIYDCKHTVCIHCANAAYNKTACLLCNRNSMNTLLSTKNYRETYHIFGSLTYAFNEILNLNDFQLKYKNELIRLLKKKIIQQREIQHKIKASFKNYRDMKEQIKSLQNENSKLKQTNKQTRLYNQKEYNTVSYQNNELKRVDQNINKELVKYKPSNDFVNGHYKNNFHGQALPSFNRSNRLSLKPDSIISSPFSKQNSSLIDPYDTSYNNNVKASKLYPKNNFGAICNKHISVFNSPPLNNNPNLNNYTFQNGLTVDPQLKEENIRSRGYKMASKEQPWNNYHKVEKWLESDTERFTDKNQNYSMTVLSTKTPIVRQTPNFLK